MINYKNSNLNNGRWCKKPGICGRDVIRESAYCYVEGSFCQRWIHRKIRGNQEEDGELNLKYSIHSLFSFIF